MFSNNNFTLTIKISSSFKPLFFGPYFFLEKVYFKLQANILLLSNMHFFIPSHSLTQVRTIRIPWTYFRSSSFNVGKEISYGRWATDGKP